MPTTHADPPRACAPSTPSCRPASRGSRATRVAISPTCGGGSTPPAMRSASASRASRAWTMSAGGSRPQPVVGASSSLRQLTDTYTRATGSNPDPRRRVRHAALRDAVDPRQTAQPHPAPGGEPGQEPLLVVASPGPPCRRPPREPESPMTPAQEAGGKNRYDERGFCTAGPAPTSLKRRPTLRRSP
jgi:hypothetical protein